MNARGRSLELFFIDGRPDGMLTAEVFGWTGHVLVTPRTQLAEALKRKEAKYTGVYILIGEGDDGAVAYIGEAEDIGYRIKSHDAAKDWWSTAVLITTAANILNKAHVRYLEARLVEVARNVNKIELENGNTPSRPSLTEAAQSNMEAFLDHILMILPALRIDFLLAQTRKKDDNTKSEVVDDATTKFELITKKHGLNAIARMDDGEFIVEEGSDSQGEWVSKGGKAHTYSKLPAQLMQQGVLVAAGDKAKFTQDYAFKSPSAAAAVVNGRPSNGTIEWKVVGSSKTYKDWEAERLHSEELDHGEILSFEDAVASAAAGKKHLMLGNGFSVALFPNIFNYKTLAENIESERIKQLFEAIDNNDFEFVMRRLLEASRIVSCYEEGDDIRAALEADIEELKRTLIQVITKAHPATPSHITDNQYNSCHAFLSHFDGHKYTFNYDLILYWVLMHFMDIEGMKLDSDDGFRYDHVEDIEDLDLSLHWEIGREQGQNLFYIHGAMHIFSDGHDIEKLSYNNIGLPLAQQVQSAIDENKFPVFISEGTTEHKLSRIKKNGYLSRTFSTLKSIGGNLYIFGHSIRDEDDHIFDFLNQTNMALKKVFIGLFGDVDALHNQVIIQKVQSWRPRNESREFIFYDSQSADVWEGK